LGVALANYLANPHVVCQVQPGKESFVLSLVVGGVEPKMEGLSQEEVIGSF